MWLWKGEIVPEPGECIADAARESVKIARMWGTPGSEHQFFTLRFNEQELSVFAESMPDEIVDKYLQSIAPKSKPSGPHQGGESQPRETSPAARTGSPMKRTDLVAVIAAIVMSCPRWSNIDKGEAVRFARQILFESEAQERTSPNDPSRT